MPKRRKATKTSWKPGQSGNPGGRLKTPEEVRAAFRETTPEALETLRRVMTLWEAAPGPATRAAEVVLERGWGKAASAKEDQEALKEAAKAAASNPAAGASTQAILAALALVEGKAAE